MLEDYILGESQNSFIVIDFYMPACFYCEQFMPDWNRVVMDADYGNGLVKFIKVDGTKIKQASQLYNVDSYPTFIIIPPGTEGMEFQRWRTKSRSFDNMKSWINDYVE